MIAKELFRRLRALPRVILDQSARVHKQRLVLVPSHHRPDNLASDVVELALFAITRRLLAELFSQINLQNYQKITKI